MTPILALVIQAFIQHLHDLDEISPGIISTYPSVTI